MHSAQSSEAIAAQILATLSEFESDQQHPNFGPTLVHEQKAPLTGLVHNRSQSFTIVHNRSRSFKVVQGRSRLFKVVHNHF